MTQTNQYPVTPPQPSWSQVDKRPCRRRRLLKVTNELTRHLMSETGDLGEGLDHGWNWLQKSVLRDGLDHG